MAEKYVNSFENFDESIVIDISKEFGSAEGVIHKDINRLNNWLVKNRIDKYKINLSGLKLPVSILKNINVDEEQRNMGYGNILMEEFIEESCVNGAKSIILESDRTEHQLTGFNLDQWYLNWDFEKIGEANYNTIFLKIL
jgi:hypothetical protein